MVRAGLLAVLLALPVPPAWAQQAPGDVVVEGDAIPEPLAVRPGDAARGRAIVANRSVGLCLLCLVIVLATQLKGGGAGSH